MVWLAKWIRENISDSRILIITDRDELDKQIEKVKNMEIIERAILLSEQELSEVKEFKNTMLSKLFVTDN